MGRDRWALGPVPAHSSRAGSSTAVAAVVPLGVFARAVGAGSSTAVAGGSTAGAASSAAVELGGSAGGGTGRGIGNSLSVTEGF